MSAQRWLALVLQQPSRAGLGIGKPTGRWTYDLYPPIPAATDRVDGLAGLAFCHQSFGFLKFAKAEIPLWHWRGKGRARLALHQ